ncbi:MAG: urea ABC transporter permease subunit UrtB [Gammaproteobacteria bacterium]|nr:urea ABC transporter permease subunit UrtB [Gammaproteobacteria bacterium]
MDPHQYIAERHAWRRYWPTLAILWSLIAAVSLWSASAYSIEEVDAAASASDIKIESLAVPAAATALAESESVSESAPAAPLDFSAAVQALNAANFSAKEQAINTLAALGDERTRAVLRALADGNLQYRKSDDKVVIVTEAADGYRLTDPLTDSDLGNVDKRDVKKISINNQLRIVLREAIARLSLSSQRVDVRLTAVEELTGNLDEAGVALLESARINESDEDVIAAMDTALALPKLTAGDSAVQLQAIEDLQGSLLPVVRNQLTALADSSTADTAVRAAATRAIAGIQGELQFYALTETIFFGLSLGSVLLLAGIGLAITFGVMGVINMAHGELIMLGAYTTYLVQQAMPQYLEYSMLVAVPAAFLVSGLFGIAIERGVIRFLYGRPLETLLATFGISLVLQQLVRTAISAQNVTVANPDWMSGSWQINAALSLTYNRLYIVIFTLVIFGALLLLLKKSSLGLHVRAVAQNRPMARAMGIRTEWVDALTFGLGSGIAGVAGVALSQLTNVGPNMGQSYIIDSFMVVVFGGVGNLWGTLVGAFSLGVANKFLEPYSGAVLAKILVLVFIILFIQKRPRGLFPQQGRGAEN